MLALAFTAGNAVQNVAVQNVAETTRASTRLAPTNLAWRHYPRFSIPMSQSQFWRVAPLLILAHALQSTWFSNSFLGIGRPDLPFLVALSAALLGGWEIGALVGIGAGLLSGLGAAWHPGSFLVSRALPPAFLGFLAGRFSVFHPVAPPLCAFVLTGVCDLLFALMSPSDFSAGFWTRHALSSGAANALLMWPVFGLTARLVRPPQRSLFTT